MLDLTHTRKLALVRFCLETAIVVYGHERLTNWPTFVKISMEDGSARWMCTVQSGPLALGGR